MQGADKRTSIIIKNIPKNMKKRDIRKMIEKYGNINFLHNHNISISFKYQKIIYFDKINYLKLIYL